MGKISEASRSNSTWGLAHWRPTNDTVVETQKSLEDKGELAKAESHLSHFLSSFHSHYKKKKGVAICLLWNTSWSTVKERQVSKATSIILTSYHCLKWDSQSNFIACVSSVYQPICKSGENSQHTPQAQRLIWNPEAGFYPNSSHVQHFCHSSFNYISSLN